MSRMHGLWVLVRDSFVEYARELAVLESAGALPEEEWPRRWAQRNSEEVEKAEQPPHR